MEPLALLRLILIDQLLADDPAEAEPLLAALAHATATLLLVDQLLEDDPTDADDNARVVATLRRAQQHAQNLVNELKEIV